VLYFWLTISQDYNNLHLKDIKVTTISSNGKLSNSALDMKPEE